MFLLPRKSFNYYKNRKNQLQISKIIPIFLKILMEIFIILDQQDMQENSFIILKNAKNYST